MRRRPILLLLLALGLAAPASGEIYRWTDDAGKEHFTTDLNAVPPMYRPGARDTAVKQKAKPVVVESDDPLRPTRNRYPASKNPPRHRHGNQRVPSREVEIGSSTCRRAQGKVRSLQTKVENAEAQIERYEDIANGTEYAESTRQRYDRRLEQAEARLESAEEALDSYVQSQRLAGLPFGCLR